MGGCNLWWWPMGNATKPWLPVFRGFLTPHSPPWNLTNTSRARLSGKQQLMTKTCSQQGSTSNSIFISLSISDPDYSSFPSPDEQNMNRGRADSRLDFFLLVKLCKASPKAKKKISFRKQKNVTPMVIKTLLQDLFGSFFSPMQWC